MGILLPVALEHGVLAIGDLLWCLGGRCQSRVEVTVRHFGSFERIASKIIEHFRCEDNELRCRSLEGNEQRTNVRTGTNCPQPREWGAPPPPLPPSVEFRCLMRASLQMAHARMRTDIAESERDVWAAAGRGSARNGIAFASLLLRPLGR